MKVTKKQQSIQRLMNQQSFLRCPICKEDLRVIENQCVCSNKHSYDIAKKGYVNFSHAKGDDFYNSSLYKSRKRLLKHGLFNKLIDETFSSMMSFKAGFQSLIDAGCGEGNFLNQLMKRINHETDFVLGIDLAKDAISLATIESEKINWFVADLTNITCKTKSCDVLINVFTPANYSEFYRMLNIDGILIKIIPNKNHFIELRKALHVKEYEQESVSQIEQVLNEKFEIISKTLSTSKISITKELNDDLIMMSPLSRSIKNCDIELNQITVDAIIYVCKKKNSI